MELQEVLRTTAAVREFTDEPLPDEVLAEILEVARFAPSGGNRQGARIIVVRDRETRERLVEITSPGAQRYAAQGAVREGPWNPVSPTSLSAAEIAATPVPAHLVEPIRKAAALLVVCIDLSAVAATDQLLDRVGLVAGGSIYPLAWNILLAARERGWGGTFTTMAIAEEPALKELLGIPDPYAVACVIPIGRPVKQAKRLTRRPVAEFTTLERFDGTPLEGPQD